VVSGHQTGQMDADRCHRGVPLSLQSSDCLFNELSCNEFDFSAR